MPTSLSSSYLAEIVGRSKSPRNDVWLIVIWAAAMLLFGALENFGAETAGPVSLQFMAAF
jgi:hypothetical protein